MSRSVTVDFDLYYENLAEQDILVSNVNKLRILEERIQEGYLNYRRSTQLKVLPFSAYFEIWTRIELLIRSVPNFMLAEVVGEQLGSPVIRFNAHLGDFSVSSTFVKYLIDEYLDSLRRNKKRFSWPVISASQGVGNFVWDYLHPTKTMAFADEATSSPQFSLVDAASHLAQGKLDCLIDKKVETIELKKRERVSALGSVATRGTNGLWSRALFTRKSSEGFLGHLVGHKYYLFEGQICKSSFERSEILYDWFESYRTLSNQGFYALNASRYDLAIAYCRAALSQIPGQSNTKTGCIKTYRLSKQKLENETAFFQKAADEETSDGNIELVHARAHLVVYKYLHSALRNYRTGIISSLLTN